MAYSGWLRSPASQQSRTRAAITRSYQRVATRPIDTFVLLATRGGSAILAFRFALPALATKKTGCQIVEGL
jgi:hypothetical protein